MGDEEYSEFRRAIHDPETVHGMIEDYRAGLGIDKEHELHDRQSGRMIACPTLCLWSKYDDLEALYGDIVGIWKNWAADVTGKAIASGHHMAEEAPDELTAELRHFLLQQVPP
jgi:haloacetate dehalogenase